METDPPTPFNQIWTLAGATSDNIVYAVSIKPFHLNLTLWSYNELQKNWTIVQEIPWLSPNRETTRFCLISACYNPTLDRVDVFVQSSNSGTLYYRFRLKSIFQECQILTFAQNGIRFQKTIAPAIHYLDENLIFIGTTEDFSMRIYRIDFTDQNFSLIEKWNGGSTYYMAPIRVASLGKKFILMKQHNRVLIFEPDFDRSIDREWTSIDIRLSWSVPDNIAEYVDEVVSLCSTPTNPNQIWFVTLFEKASQAILSVDGRILQENRKIEWNLEEEIPCTAGTHFQTTAVSNSHFFWVHGGRVEGYKILSRKFSLPDLQYLCLEKLMEESDFKNCDTKRRAIELGIPVTAWKKYFPHREDETGI